MKPHESRFWTLARVAEQSPCRRSRLVALRKMARITIGARADFGTFGHLFRAFFGFKSAPVDGQQAAWPNEFAPSRARTLGNRGLPWPDGFVAFPPAHWGGTANGGRLPESPEAWARASQGRYSGPKASWLGLRLHDQVQQTGKLAGCDGRNGQPAPEYFNPALSDGGALTGIISGLPAYRGCCPATAGVGSLPPRSHKLVTCDAGRMRSPAVGNRHRKGLRFVAALFLSSFFQPFTSFSQLARKNRHGAGFACPHDGVHHNATCGASP